MMHFSTLVRRLLRAHHRLPRVIFRAYYAAKTSAGTRRWTLGAGCGARAGAIRGFAAAAARGWPRQSSVASNIPRINWSVRPTSARLDDAASDASGCWSIRSSSFGGCSMRSARRSWTVVLRTSTDAVLGAAHNALRLALREIGLKPAFSRKQPLVEVCLGVLAVRFVLTSLNIREYCALGGT